MAGGSGSGQKQLFNDINITPLTDIFLVLLIIMMVVAPMSQDTPKNVKMPEINSGQSVEQSKVTVDIDSAGVYYVNGVVTAPNDLSNALSALSAKSDKHLVVRADKDTKSKEVLAMFEAARDAKFEKVTIAGEPLSAKQQRDLREAAPHKSKPEVPLQ